MAISPDADTTTPTSPTDDADVDPSDPLAPFQRYLTSALARTIRTTFVTRVERTLQATDHSLATLERRVRELQKLLHTLQQQRCVERQQRCLEQGKWERERERDEQQRCLEQKLLCGRESSSQRRANTTDSVATQTDFPNPIQRMAALEEQLRRTETRLATVVGDNRRHHGFLKNKASRTAGEDGNHRRDRDEEEAAWDGYSDVEMGGVEVAGDGRRRSSPSEEEGARAITAVSSIFEGGATAPPSKMEDKKATLLGALRALRGRH